MPVIFIVFYERLKKCMLSLERIATIPLVKIKSSKIPLKEPSLPKYHCSLGF
jgi:hypothetical protein